MVGGMLLKRSRDYIRVCAIVFVSLISSHALSGLIEARVSVLFQP